MAKPTISNSEDLALAIKIRRSFLKMTIEEAAGKAGVTAKTWSGYENGHDIATGKVDSICKALGWKKLPQAGDEINEESVKNAIISTLENFNEEYETWPNAIEEEHGTMYALAFWLGTDVVIDRIKDDIEKLSEMPANSHIGQVDPFFIADGLPSKYLTKYDYEFMLKLKATIKDLKYKMKKCCYCSTPLEQIAFCLVFEEGLAYIESAQDADDDFEAFKQLKILMKMIEEKSKNDIKELDKIEEEYEESEIPDEEYDEDHYSHEWNKADNNINILDGGFVNWKEEIFTNDDEYEGLFERLYDEDLYLPPSDAYHFDNWEEDLYPDENRSGYFIDTTLIKTDGTEIGTIICNYEKGKEPMSDYLRRVLEKNPDKDEDSKKKIESDIEIIEEYFRYIKGEGKDSEFKHYFIKTEGWNYIVVRNR